MIFCEYLYRKWTLTKKHAYYSRKFYLTIRQNKCLVHMDRAKVKGPTATYLFVLYIEKLLIIFILGITQPYKISL